MELYLLFCMSVGLTLSRSDAPMLEGLEILFVERKILYRYRGITLAQVVTFVEVERRAYEREGIVAVLGVDAADGQQRMENYPRVEGGSVALPGLLHL